MRQNDVVSLLKRWPNRKSVFDDVRKANPDLQMIAVHRWFSRASVPSGYWMALIEGAKRRNIYLTTDELAQAHALHNEQCVQSVQGSSGEESLTSGSAA